MGFFQNVYFFYFLMVKNRKLTDNTSVPILVTWNVKVISKVKGIIQWCRLRVKFIITFDKHFLPLITRNLRIRANLSLC